MKLGNAKGLAKVVAFMRCWLTRGAGAPRTVRLEIDGDVIEPSHASSSETDRLVELFLARHSPTEPMR